MSTADAKGCTISGQRGSHSHRAVPQVEPDDKQFPEYPDESIADWHERLGLTD